MGQVSGEFMFESHEKLIFHSRQVQCNNIDRLCKVRTKTSANYLIKVMNYCEGANQYDFFNSLSQCESPFKKDRREIKLHA